MGLLRNRKQLPYEAPPPPIFIKEVGGFQWKKDVPKGKKKVIPLAPEGGPSTKVRYKTIRDMSPLVKNAYKNMFIRRNAH